MGFMQSRKILPVLFVFISFCANAQKIDSIYVNLYTDSLKKGTYNYINVDGKLSNGNYIPLDSSHLIFWASEGKFSGNSLWIDKDFKYDRVLIKVLLRGNPKLNKEFTIYIKKKPDNEKLATEEELLNEIQNKTGKNKKKNG